MSYCRFSSEDFASDVYVYEDVCGGYTTHVARARVDYASPLPPRVSFAHDPTAFVNREIQVLKIVEHSPRELIDLPMAGETFSTRPVATIVRGRVRYDLDQRFAQ